MKPKSSQPEYLRILGKDWLLEFTDLSRSTDTLFGLTDFSARRISIAERFDTARKTSTMLHEAIEAINSELELNLQHPAINALETGIFQVIIENPVLLGMLNTVALEEK